MTSPTTRMVRVTGGPVPAVWLITTGMSCPIRTCAAVIVLAPSAISPGPAGARPARIVT